MNGTQITIVGNLTDDPELRFTPSGDAVVKFSVAFNRRVFDRQTNEWKDGKTDFHRVVAWRQLAQNAAETLTKGTRVVVVGDLRQHHWEDEATKQQRSAWEVNAEAIGPDLTWATATVTRTKGGARDQAPPDDPWSTASKQRPAGEPNREEHLAGAAGPRAGQGAWPQGSGARGPQAGYSDEPPF
jgi:single-strand DNA-binding protein